MSNHYIFFVYDGLSTAREGETWEKPREQSDRHMFGAREQTILAECRVEWRCGSSGDGMVWREEGGGIPAMWYRDGGGGIDAERGAGAGALTKYEGGDTDKQKKNLSHKRGWG